MYAEQGREPPRKIKTHAPRFLKTNEGLLLHTHFQQRGRAPDQSERGRRAAGGGEPFAIFTHNAPKRQTHAQSHLLVRSEEEHSRSPRMGGGVISRCCSSGGKGRRPLLLWLPLVPPLSSSPYARRCPRIESKGLVSPLLARPDARLTPVRRKLPRLWGSSVCALFHTVSRTHRRCSTNKLLLPFSSPSLLPSSGIDVFITFS